MKAVQGYLFCMAAVFCCGATFAGDLSVWGQWHFDVNFDEDGRFAADGASRESSSVIINPGSSAFSVFNGALVCGQTGPTDFLRVDVDDLFANGGGRYVNEYTLVYDIKLSTAAKLPLLNTGSDNYNAAELWIRADGAVGAAGNYTDAGQIKQGQWTRLVVTFRMDGGISLRNIYIDGALVQGDMPQGGLDGNASLYTSSHRTNGQFTILSDNDSNIYAGCELGAFGFVGGAIGDSDIAILGGYSADGIGLEDITNPPDEGLVGSWVLSRDHITGNIVEDLSPTGADGAISGTANINPKPEAMIFNGSNNYITVADGPLPSREITLEAWVRADAAVTWAGILCYIQDNGSTEHGWILGQKDGAFTFGLSTGSLTYLNADSSFEPERWYHVAGTYDGAQMIIYVNGQPAGSSNSRSGDISYIDSTFNIGRYKDDNEQYLWNGMIAEAKIYDITLSPEDIQSHYQGRKDDFKSVEAARLKAGPYVHFSKKDQVTVYWQTAQQEQSQIEYWSVADSPMTLNDPAPKTTHKMTLTGIRPETQYSYRILYNDLSSDVYSFYSEFDFGPDPVGDLKSPYPVDELTAVYAQAAEYIINSSGLNKGVCIDYGCGVGRLAYEISKRSDLKIIGFQPDSAKVAQARSYLDRAGIYGTRVSILNMDMADLKCRDYSANLVVSDAAISEGICPGVSSEVHRVLRPDGGMAILGQPSGSPIELSRDQIGTWMAGYSHTLTAQGDPVGLWARIERGPLPGAGEWTHIYANTANTANSGETGITNSLQLLWYGKPGPRYVIDRHNRPMPSLFKKGIVIMSGANRIMAYDAYNGTRYWDMSIPQVSRVVVLRDCGWMAMAEDHVYVVHNQSCAGFDIQTGQPKVYLQAPQLTEGQVRNWGYVALADQAIIGSGQKDGSSLQWKGNTRVSESYWDYRPISTSEYLFCLDRHTGQQKWTYKRDGGSAILNPSIVTAEGYVYFIESRNPNAINDVDGRVKTSVLSGAAGEYIVKLNLADGTPVRSEPVDLPFEHTTFLLYDRGEDILIAAGSRNDPGCRYEQQAFHAEDLSPAWSSNYYLGGTNGDHGEQDQHPCIVGDEMFLRHYKVRLSDGHVTTFGLSRGNCGTQSACATHLMGRNGNPYLYALPGGNPIRLTSETRPGCWINIIAAGGLVLVPEASSGCTCDFSIQTTMSFMPR